MTKTPVQGRGNGMNIQCNWCMTIYLEDEDNPVIECLKCGTDSYLMELIEVYTNA